MKDVATKVRTEYERYPFPKENDDTGLNIDFILKQIKALNLKGKTVLDVGCGTGFYSCAFAMLGYKVKAIDFSKPSLEIAKANAKALGVKIDFQQSDIFKYKDKNKYDIVFCWGVLHHTKDAKGGFNKISKLVKPNGFLVISILNKNLYHERFSRKLAKMGGDNIEKRLAFVKRNKKLFLFIVYLWKYKNHLTMGDNTLIDLFCHEHVKYFSKKEIEKWFEENNFKVLNNDGFFQTTYIGVNK